MLPRILKSSRAWRRCFCDKPPPAEAKDPVYQAFLDKVREYRLKSPTGKPFEPNPEYDEELKEAIEKLALRYGGGEGINLLDFPKFKLPVLDIDPISIYDLPEYKDKEVNGDEKVEEDPEKKGKSKGEVKGKKGDKKVEDMKKEVKSKSGVKDNKEEKGEKEEKAKDDKKAKPKDEKK